MPVGRTMATAVVFPGTWFCFDLEKCGLLCSWRLQVGSRGRASWGVGRSPWRTMTCLCHFPFSPWAVWSWGQPVSHGVWVGSGGQGAAGEGTYLGVLASSSRMRPGSEGCVNRGRYPVCPFLPLSSQVSKQSHPLRSRNSKGAILRFPQQLQNLV